MKKTVCLLLSLLLLLPAFASCGESQENADSPDAENTTQTADPAADLTEETETEDNTVRTALPEDLDFGGASYVIAGQSVITKKRMIAMCMIVEVKAFAFLFPISSE